MQHFEDLIEQIERDLLTDIDIDALARQVNLSVYEFRRIFTFVTKIPVGEYIRKRRLSLAAVELFEGHKNITEIAGKYGYNSPSSFSRAFKEFHELAPADVMAGNGSFKLLTKINVEIVLSGCRELSYSVKETPGFWVCGVRGTSTMSDSECCEDVWSAFYESPVSEELLATGKELYAVYQNAHDAVECHIGIRGDASGAHVWVPEGLWACFPMVGTDDETVNAFYGTVLNRWFLSVGYERDPALPNLEIFPSDMSADEFPWEIRIPIKRRENHGKE